jgi:hypothetical protein
MEGDLGQEQGIAEAKLKTRQLDVHETVALSSLLLEKKCLEE